MSRIPNKMPIPEVAEAASESAAPAVKSFAPPKFPTKVQALRKGFYKQVRRNVGDEFICEKAEQLGSWMKLV